MACCSLARRHQGGQEVTFHRHAIKPRSSSRTLPLHATSSDPSPSPPPYEEDARISVKIDLAKSLGKLDLSDMELTSLPPQVLELGDALEELSLAGNRLVSLPDDLHRLSSLRRLGLAGNLLESLPPSFGRLTALEGLWLHGNQLSTLPESFGDCSLLRVCSLAGNRLVSLPDSIGSLTCLEQLALSGNLLTSLPDSIGQLGQLTQLQLNGNQLSSLPESIGSLSSLEQLALQGNALTGCLPSSLTTLSALQVLNVADNALTTLVTSDTDVSSCAALHTVLCYGNRLTSLPISLAHAPSMQFLWAEGNDALRGLDDFLRAVVAADASRRAVFEQESRDKEKEDPFYIPPVAGNGKRAWRVVGLDETQASFLSPETHAAAASLLRIGVTAPGQGPGYFKLQLGPTSPPSDSLVVASITKNRGRALIVAFGSAPGDPNWAGLLKRVQQSIQDVEQKSFDVLFVVDPARSWYGGGHGALYEYYRARLESITKQYQRVLLLGDSMGATATLLFSELATDVISFCPQLDLTTSAIRPGTGPDAWRLLRAELLRAVEAAGAAATSSRSPTNITVHTGSWQHDLDQARVLPIEWGHVALKIYSIDSHRLAAYLQSRERLVPLVKEVLLTSMGFRCTDNVRLTNLL